MHRCSSLIGSLLITLLTAGCATVSTEIVPLSPGLKFAPTQNVDILFERPQRPYREIALLESRGMVGDSEVQLWQDARAKAQALGADALLRVDVYKTVVPPMAIYDPFLTPYYSPFYPTPYFFAYPFPEYRVLPGGVAYTLKTVAIRYEATNEGK